MNFKIDNNIIIKIILLLIIIFLLYKINNKNEKFTEVNMQFLSKMLVDGGNNPPGRVDINNITANSGISYKDFYAGELNVNILNLLPSGAIAAWYGTLSSIPSTWEIVDNYKDKFLLGASSTYALSSTGGASSVVLNTAQIPYHTHSVNTIPDGNTWYAWGDNANESYSSAWSDEKHTDIAGNNDAHNNIPQHCKLYLIRKK